MTKLRTIAAFGVALSLCACKVGPKYERPTLDVPGGYRGTAPETQQSQPAATPGATGTSNQAPASSQTSATHEAEQMTPTSSELTHPQVSGQPLPAGQSFGETLWPAVFQDQELQALIKEGLTNNYDLRIAATRILQAAANVGIVRANQLPSVDGQGAITGSRNYTATDPFYVGNLGVAFNYIVDFWGQYRSATEAARAQLLATEYGKNVVQISLIASIATNYYLLGQYDDQLDYSKKTVAADEEILKLNNIKFKGGDAAMTDVYQAQVLLQQAQAGVITYQQLVEQTENNLSILLGRNPGPIKRGLNLVDQPHPPEIPIGLPSDLLRRRPDIRAAEENLIAANSNVGVAKALFFPQFSLTAAAGLQSASLGSFVEGPGAFWSAGAGLVQPIFEGGRIRSNYKLAWAQRDQAELQYKQAVQRAMGEVSNNLIGYQQARQYRIKLQEQTKTYGDLVRLSNIRYQGGYTAFLEVQYNEQQYFQSALALSQAWFQEMQYYAGLYQALGGGWEVQ